MKHSVLFVPILRTKGVILLFAGLFFSGLGIFTDITKNDLITITLLYYGIIFLFFALNYLQIKYKVKSIKVAYDVPARLFSNEKAFLDINIDTGNLIQKSKILFRPEVVAGIELINQIKSLVVGNQENKLSFEILPFERGEKVWTKLYLRVSSPLEFVYWQVDFVLPPKVSRVYPNFSQKSDSSSKAFDYAQTGEFSINRIGRGREFDYLKNYLPGEDTRKIDWKHSAKKQKLVVKLYKPESHQLINIALDCSRRLLGVTKSRELIEHAADAAARLVKFAAHCEDEVGFFAFNNKVISSCPAKRGSSQQNRIIHELSEVKVEEVEPDYQLLTEWALRKNKRSLLVLITSISNPIAVETILKSLVPVSRKHQLLLVSIADREIESIAQEKAANLQDAYIISAASEQSDLINKRLLELNRRGIETITCNAEELKNELLKKYYRMKALGKI